MLELQSVVGEFSELGCIVVPKPPVAPYNRCIMVKSAFIGSAIEIVDWSSPVDLLSSGCTIQQMSMGSGNVFVGVGAFGVAGDSSLHVCDNSRQRFASTQEYWC